MKVYVLVINKRYERNKAEVFVSKEMALKQLEKVFNETKEKVLSYFPEALCGIENEHAWVYFPDIEYDFEMCETEVK